MRYGFLLLILFAFIPSALLAIDNPDAPDLVGDFLHRAAPLEKAVGLAGDGGRDDILVYRKYQAFLDEELNRAYRLLMSKLDPPLRSELRDTQRRWIAFRDAEFIFINGNWTRDRFGSSANISRGAYRCTIIKDRVIQLLLYAKNYL